jgi:hypothetical protein
MTTVIDGTTGSSIAGTLNVSSLLLNNVSTKQILNISQVSDNAEYTFTSESYATGGVNATYTPLNPSSKVAVFHSMIVSVRQTGGDNDAAAYFFSAYINSLGATVVLSGDAEYTDAAFGIVNAGTDPFISGSLTFVNADVGKNSSGDVQIRNYYRLATDATSGYAATGYMRGQTVIFIEYL